MSTNTMPRQKTLSSQKTKEWGEQCVNAIIDSAIATTIPDGTGSQYDIKTLDDFYNGKIGEEAYASILKPYGKERDNMPVKVRNYNIIKPIIDLLIGEKIKRATNTSVNVLNSDVTTKRTEALLKKLTKAAEQRVINKMIEMGAPIEGQVKKVPDNDYIEAEFETSYRDERAIIGQHALNYIMDNQKVIPKFNDGYKDYLVAGKVFSKKGVVNDEPEYVKLKAYQVNYSKEEGLEFIEDASWQVYTRWMTSNKIIDNYYSQLTPSQIDEIERAGDKTTSKRFVISSGSMDSRYDDDDISPIVNKMEVFTVYWKTFEKVGIIEYYDEELQETLFKEVDDKYKPSKSEKVEWYWRNQAWEGTRIGDNIYIDVQPLPIQRRSLDNISSCKLPINGRVYYGDTSLVQALIPYQLDYNIARYKLNLSIAKSKDAIMMIDINMIPTNHNFDIDQFLWYMESAGIGFIDGNKEGLDQSRVNQTVLDTTVRNIADQIMRIEKIKEDAESLAGVSRQRLGQTGQYELKSTTEQSITQSSHTTEETYSRYVEFENKELMGLLDYSKPAWINGKKAAYILPDNTTQVFEIDGVQYSEIEFGITIPNSFEDRNKLEQAKLIAGEFVKQGGSAIEVIDMISADSLPMLRKKLVENATKKEQREKEMMESEQAMMQKQEELEMMKLENENMNLQKDRDLKLQIALIQAEINKDIAEIKGEYDDTSDWKDSEISLEHKKAELQAKLKLAELKSKESMSDKELTMREKIERIKAAAKSKSVISKR